MCFPGQVEVALTNQAAVDVRVVGMFVGVTIIAGPLSLLTCAQGSQLTVVFRCGAYCCTTNLKYVFISGGSY